MTTRKSVNEVADNLRAMIHIETMPAHLKGQLAVAVVILEDLAKEYDEQLDNLTQLTFLSLNADKKTMGGRRVIAQAAERIQKTLPVAS